MYHPTPKQPPVKPTTASHPHRKSTQPNLGFRNGQLVGIHRHTHQISKETTPADFWLTKVEVS